MNCTHTFQRQGYPPGDVNSPKATEWTYWPKTHIPWCRSSSKKLKLAKEIKYVIKCLHIYIYISCN